MKNTLLLGDEVIAQAALDAGISGMFAYPGTPSTEITEYIQNSKQAAERKVHSFWAANEKTSMEMAVGMSYAGKRSMVAMKHVGLNVAADAFINSALTGVNGGLLVVVADDPSMHSSQNEQDSRFYAKFSFIPCFEPSNQQEAYEMVFDAFELSEKYKLPVLLRITTRLAHSRSAVKLRNPMEEKQFPLPQDQLQFVLLPMVARKKYKLLLEAYENFKQDECLKKYNHFKDGNNRKMGVIACGIAYNYLTEMKAEDSDFPILRIAAYPFSKDVIKNIVDKCESVLILEDGAPMLEESLRGILDEGIKVLGRMDGTIPRDGELTPAIVAKALGVKTPKEDMSPLVKNRPPSFCKGCGHADMFLDINEALKPYPNGRVFSDIGCYTLGALPPYNSIISCLDMGAAVTMAVGAAEAGLFPSLCVIGDSTFTHSGITGLLDGVIRNTSVTIIIADNSTVAMTGGQDSHAVGRLAEICKGTGVDAQHIREIIPLPKNHEENVRIIREEIEFKGVSVIIASRECIQTLIRKKNQTHRNFVE